MSIFGTYRRTAPHTLAVALLLILGPTVSAAQTDPGSSTTFQFERQDLMSTGQFFRAFKGVSEESRSWTIRDVFNRANAAIGSGHWVEAQVLLGTADLSAMGRTAVPQAAMQEALILIERGDLRTARRVLQTELLSSAPASVLDSSLAGRALYWVAASRLMESETGPDSVVLRELEHSARDYPANPRADDALFLMAQLHERSGRNNEALYYYNTLLERYPTSEHRRSAALRRAVLDGGRQPVDDPETEQFRQLMYSVDEAEPILAIERLQEYAERTSDSEWADDALFVSAILQYRSADYACAVETMGRIVEESDDPELIARAWFTIIDAEFKSGTIEQAARSHRAATEHFPEFCSTVGHYACEAVSDFTKENNNSATIEDVTPSMSQRP